MKLKTTVLLCLLLAGCVTEPVVTDFNGDSVKIQTIGLATPARSAATDAEALRICQAGGKRRAEYASSRDLRDGTGEHLYLCLN